MPSVVDYKKHIKQISLCKNEDQRYFCNTEINKFGVKMLCLNKLFSIFYVRYGLIKSLYLI